jgi:PPM family protein phosphatase
MALTFRSTAHSEVGLVRKNNQDSAYASADLIVVADGMGGAAAGDLASAVAVKAISDLDADLAARLEAATEQRPTNAPDGLPDGPTGDLLAVTADALDRANQALAALTEDDPALDGMGTTLCGFILLGDGAGLVNIGDSRAYLLRDGVLGRVSKDHSWVQTLVDAGRITEEEALDHPHRSLIMRVLNGKPNHHPDLEFLELHPDDRLLVCSDGLCGLVTDAQIAPLAANPDREVAVASLVDLAHAAGGYDNITIILADVVEGEPTDGVQVLGSARTQQVPSLAEPTTRIPLLPSRTPRARNPEDERYAPVSGRGTRLGLKVALGILLPVLVLVAGGFGWYSYSQTRFYLGPNDQAVAVFRGVPDTIVGRPLSQVVAEDGVLLSELPPLYVDQVKKLIPVTDLAAGKSRLAELKVIAAKCVAQRAAHARASEAPATPSPSPTGSASPTAPSGSAAPSAVRPRPSGTASATASATASTTPSPTPSPAQPTAPGDC